MIHPFPEYTVRIFLFGVRNLLMKDTFDFEAISKALKETYDVIKAHEQPSELALQNLLEAKESLHEAIMHTLEKDRPAL